MRRSLGISEPEPAELEISPMKRRHLKGVMAIERQVYPRPWSPSLFISEMSETTNRAYLVAKLGKDVVSYGGVICYGDEAHITTIAVDPAHHRRKIGTRMMFELLSEAIRLGAKAVSLEVRMSNWGAQRMYGRYGFRPVGVRKGYYQETGEDALVMWADDVDGEEYRRTLDAIISAVPDGVRPRS
jgi:[ribosomal protein S18]-alanine N-acetyltransferase